MADFNDAADPELGAACNRLAAFCEALPAEMVIDRASGLSEPDLVLILRRLHATRLHATRLDEQSEPPSPSQPSDEQPPSRVGVPLTAKK